VVCSTSTTATAPTSRSSEVSFTSPPPRKGSKILADRLELLDRRPRLARQRPDALLETMVDVIVDQRLLGIGDRLLDGVELLREIEAAALRLDHRDDLAQMALGAFQPIADGRVGLVRGLGHRHNLSPWRGYVESTIYRDPGVSRPAPQPRWQLEPVDQLDLVAVGILDEGDHRSAALDRAGGTRNLHAAGDEPLADAVELVDADGEGAKGGAGIIGLLAIPVMRQLDHRRILLVAIADEGDGIAPGLVVAAPAQRHTEMLGVEIDRFLEIEHADHGVQHARLANHGLAGGGLVGGPGVHRFVPPRSMLLDQPSGEPRSLMTARKSSAARRLGAMPP